MASAAAISTYEPRHPEQTVLYQAVREHLDAFLSRCAEADRLVPDFVEKELRAFLDCGRVELGAVRVRCPACGFDRLVPCSCKGRGGICPSCGARRMAETAAQLVDHVLPEAPYRQFVLTVPVPLRYILAYNAEVYSDVIGALMHAIFASIKRRTKLELGLESADNLHPGGICFVQRFGSSGANLHPHLHAVVADGVFIEDEQGELRFHSLAEPTRGELNAIAWSTCQRAVALLRKRGLWLDDEPGEDTLAAEHPVLAALATAAISGCLLFGEKGKRPMKLFAAAARSGDAAGKPPKNAYGFDLDASVRVPANDRKRLERLLRYMGRPALSRAQLQLLPDGRYCLRFKRPWSDGSTAVVLTGAELMARLAALVPPPRMHLVRYFGVFAPRSQMRERLLPPQPEAAAAQACRHDAGHGQVDSVHARQKRMTWAQLLKRVFDIDILECPRCHARMQQIAVITSPAVIRSMLDCMQNRQGP